MGSVRLGSLGEPAEIVGQVDGNSPQAAIADAASGSSLWEIQPGRDFFVPGVSAAERSDQRLRKHTHRRPVAWREKVAMLDLAVFGFNVTGPLERAGLIRARPLPDRHGEPDGLEIQVVTRVSKRLKHLGSRRIQLISAGFRHAPHAFLSFIGELTGRNLANVLEAFRAELFLDLGAAGQ